MPETIYTADFEAPMPPLKNLASIVLSDSLARPSDTLFVDPDAGKSYTLDDVRRITGRVAYELQYTHNIKEGDVVGLYTHNQALFSCLILGAMSIGAVVSTMSYAYLPAEARHAMIVAGMKMLLVLPELRETAIKAVKLPKQDDEEETERLQIDGSLSTLVNISKFLEIVQQDGPCISPKEFSELKYKNDPAFLCFSSGTTGKFKAVMLTQHNIATNIYQVAHTDPDYFAGQVYLCNLPQFHLYGLTLLGVLAPFQGTKVINMPKFDFTRFIELIIEYKVTKLLVVPPMLVTIAKSPLTVKYQKELTATLNQLNSGAAPLSASLVQEVEGLLPGVVVTQGYGLTETSPTAFQSPRTRPFEKFGSAGKLVPNLEARIIDEDGNDLPRNPESRGELCLRGPSIFKGYYRNEEATKNAFLPGRWFKTGDVATVDNEGYWYIVDRAKELIKSKGFQVAPAELEALLLTHPDVVDSAVIGIYSEEEATEYPRAFIAIKPGSKLEKDPGSVVEWVNDKVARYKRLWGGVVVLEQIPKSASGKILRRELRLRKNDVVHGLGLAKRQSKL
ncbi:hypothetical protein CANCADRAFT_55315 [Tortispora caseinolytica NRRL Y-17796]|uniref:AMP-dependent synthetase/ligase domain-containing protein n=1 Tax=Tortispora caseinolytica NRRL Y-17796 TaxID=767744 RepID=A0A1E4TI46_9ASCO|nr:hypothetical protein CANCADRAFT_55315 [Tortispora caseinolytica NRRL Y-17796]